MAKIEIKNSTSTAIPTITSGELALCTLAGSEKLYTKNSAGNTINLLDFSTIKGTTLTDKVPLSPEMLTSNGWVTNGWTGNYTTNFGHDEGNIDSLTNSIAAVSGNRYIISLSTIDGGDGSLTVSFGGISKFISGDDSVNFGVLATNASTLVITPTSDFIGTIYGLSIKLITGVISPIITCKDSLNNITNEIRCLAGDSIYCGKNSGRYSTGSKNTGVGNGALYNNIDGGFNTGIGCNSLYNNINGWMNVGIGQSAGINNLFGTNNIFVGYSAGSTISVGQSLKNSTNSIFIGSNTKALVDDGINEIVIGAYGTGLGSNTTTIGTPDTITTRLYGNMYSTGEVTAYQASDLRLKKNINKINNGLEIIEKLQPVVYQWNNLAKELNSNKTDAVDVGLIAQELEEVLPNLIHPIYSNYKSIDYIKLIPYLISAIKELKQEVNDLNNKINKQ